MHNRIARFAFFWVVLGYGFSTPAVWAENNTARPSNSLLFCYQDIELYPNYTGNTAEVPTQSRGINIDLVQLAIRQVGLEPIYVRYPWKRCLALLKLGRVDSVIASYRADRTEVAVYPMAGAAPDNTKMITLSGYYLYQKQKEPEQWDGTNFINPDLIIGSPLGYSITAELKDQGRKIVEAGTTAGLLQMLLYGRVQAVAAPGAAADTLLLQKSAELSSIRKISTPLKINHYFIVFSHQFYERSPDTAEQVWEISPMVYAENVTTLRAKYTSKTEQKSKPPT